MVNPYTIELDGASLQSFPLEPELARGAVIICPGGGYRVISDREGRPVAEAWRRAGYHAFVLGYSVEPAPLGLLPLRQLAEAVARVRAMAGELGIAPDRIAVMGFSAGGHLAASLGVMWHREDIFGPGDRRAHRPDALLLAYPVITGGPLCHGGSVARLAGEDRAGWATYSLENQVTEETPPTFLWHTVEDDAVPVENSLLFAQALRAKGITLELHLYPRGLHGMSLATADTIDPARGHRPDPHVATWLGLAQGFLEEVLGA